MESVYLYIQQNPDYFAWIFCVLNVLWAGYVYFNKQRHDKNLKELQHSLNLDLERRKKIFELKISHYERYVKMLDEFGRKYQSELFNRMQPIFARYMAEMLDCETEVEKSAALSQFSMQVMELMSESMREYAILKSESKSLKLTASAALIKTFEELESLVEHSIESAKEFINQFPVLIMSNNQTDMQTKQGILNGQGQDIQLKSKELEQQMRIELNEI
ncbi:conserved hypothetical protein [Paraglaciecola sp. T6c]|uniref:hypothetical protein n=1 Tax=Pseudoalteromonas atlantica (strain T6c / ATCC BAA-1087) TaxID=3042615 RepID=UPI00005C5932|nr:hypothetical protein [Paraglaciecola sp. T6c]ABG39202.1 conserved hypothetical protein [Paraglaciecola sp. T6c]